MVLMGSQSLISGIKLAMGSLASPLWCHQRIDLSNLASSLSLLVIFVIQWIGFHLGWHLYSLPIATSLGLVVSLFFIWHSCRRLGLYPPPQFRGQYDPKIFRELLHFGSGIFLLNLGAQMASASQVVVASRLLGMEAAATWSISTKIFTMAQQFVSRIIDSSAGGLAEMVVREEHYQLQNRYKDLVSISATMAALACTGIALMNGSYIEIWTSGRVFWNPWNDLVLAFVLFATSVTRCHTSLVGINKQIRGMKYIYLLEGIAFIGVSLLLVPWIGLTGLLISALVCNIGITGSYGISRTSDFFGITKSAVVSWIMRPALAVFFGACLFIVMRFHVIAGQEAITRFALAAMAFLIAILPVIWFFGLEPRIKLEVISLIKKICRSAKSRLGITC
jgi:O-antigen/teichoic acid export membrane protein